LQYFAKALERDRRRQPAKQAWCSGRYQDLGVMQRLLAAADQERYVAEIQKFQTLNPRSEFGIAEGL